MREFEKNIRKVEPYVPGEQPQKKVIKLNTNENPYPLCTGSSCGNEKAGGSCGQFKAVSGSDI